MAAVARQKKAPIHRALGRIGVSRFICTFPNHYHQELGRKFYINQTYSVWIVFGGYEKLPEW